MKTITAVTVITLLICSCIGDEDYSDSGDTLEMEPVDSSLVVCREWVEYLESSDEGLWEDSTEHILEYSYSGPFVVENEMDPVLYSPFALCSSGDTVFVTDASTRQVVALNSEGDILWKIGGQGEGPGFFAHMSTLAVSNRYVAVLDYAQARIQFFHRDGSFSHSQNFQFPQDIATIDDTTFAVASSTQPGGHIHILNSETGIVKSFGYAELEEYEEIPRMDLMRLCYGDNGRIALFNRYEGLIAIYDIETSERVFGGSRDYPLETPPPRRLSNGSMLYCPLGGNVFKGPDGTLNVIMCNYMENGTFASDPEYRDFAPVSPVDRYDWDGHYLDSYCLPDSCINFVTELPNGDCIGRDFAEGILVRMSRI
jgi:hypothetical protein